MYLSKQRIVLYILVPSFFAKLYDELNDTVEDTHRYNMKSLYNFKQITRC